MFCVVSEKQLKCIPLSERLPGLSETNWRLKKRGLLFLLFSSCGLLNFLDACTCLKSNRDHGYIELVVLDLIGRAETNQYFLLIFGLVIRLEEFIALLLTTYCWAYVIFKIYWIYFQKEVIKPITSFLIFQTIS